ncbi:sulfotransferase [Thalassotalea nanhaiensis]|uniref:Sulfotransferase n=1 Tax=Thalassotalea nanhaiensis TaxID=3065648 RepID=A0ABY9TJ49_9GAMM|nr:sulfotransferase [Colwelliaceae bacterium SQ345]
MNSITSQELQPQLQDLLKQGFFALSKQKFDTASEICQKILTLKPDLVPGHFLVGLVGLASKNKRIAFSAFQSVVKLDNDHVAAWANLAKLYMDEGKVNLADQALQHTRRIKTNDPLVLDLIGTTLSMMGEHGLAKMFFIKANEIKPNHPLYMGNLSNCLIYHGETAAAESILRDIIKLRANSAQAHWSISKSIKAKDESHIDEMQQLLANNKNNNSTLAFYQYAIGKEYEDLQQWPQAFSAFELGAKAKREANEYDVQAEIQTFQCLIDNYTKEWLDQGSTGNPTTAPIFVLGQPRTGTTLIERIITAHSDVTSAGELQQFGLALRRLSKTTNKQRFSSELLKAAKDLDSTKVANMYLRSTKRMQGDTKRFVDKLPQNYLLIPLILKAFPNAKIVHLVRNPMDACFASYKQLFADAYLHSYNQEEMARHHVRYLELMQIWRERFPGRFFDISYEQTARDLEPNARALIEFLDLPWQDACLNFHSQDSAVTTASAVQVREPAHTRSIGRWRKYEQQLQPMLNTLKAHGVDISE